MVVWAGARGCVDDSLIRAFVMLFVVIDPIGQIPIFIALTRGTEPRQRRWLAVRGVLIAGGILFLFTLVGNWLLQTLGIGLAAMKIAGGILLFILAVEMILALESGMHTTTVRELEEAEQRPDISVFPLAIPLLAGPGAFAAITLLLGPGSEPAMTAWVLGLLALVLGLTLVALLFAAWLMRLLGQTGANVISRVLGILLAALAVQFVLDGVRDTGLMG